MISKTTKNVVNLGDKDISPNSPEIDNIEKSATEEANHPIPDQSDETLAKSAQLVTSSESGITTNPRNLDVLKIDILNKRKTIELSFYDIGQSLIEVKNILGHGKFGHWVENNVGFSEREAQRFMRVAREYSNPTSVSDIGVTKALALLDLPHSDREKFMKKEHKIKGIKKSVVEMTKRELVGVIREHPKAKKGKKPNMTKSTSTAKIPNTRMIQTLAKNEIDVIKDAISISHIKYIQTCINSVLDCLGEYSSGIENYDELYYALFELCRDTLDFISNSLAPPKSENEKNKEENCNV